MPQCRLCLSPTCGLVRATTLALRNRLTPTPRSSLSTDDISVGLAHWRWCTSSLASVRRRISNAGRVRRPYREACWRVPCACLRSWTTSASSLTSPLERQDIWYLIMGKEQVIAGTWSPKAVSRLGCMPRSECSPRHSTSWATYTHTETRPSRALMLRDSCPLVHPYRQTRYPLFMQSFIPRSPFRYLGMAKLMRLFLRYFHLASSMRPLHQPGGRPNHHHTQPTSKMDCISPAALVCLLHY